MIERAQILCQNQQIKYADLGLTSPPKVAIQTLSTPTELVTLEAIELDIIDQRLSFFDGNVLKAAKSLGLSRSAFYRRLEKL